MKARAALVISAAAILAIFVWLIWPDHDGALVHGLTLNRPAPAYAGPSTSVPVAPGENTPPEPRSELADQLNSPTSTIQADLRIVANLIDSYRSIFHENPIGTNAEITAALMGRNRLHVALLPPDHPAVNLKGELCDRWGRPFFFHQISGTHMGLRSSGPDKTMWTDDDIVLEP